MRVLVLMLLASFGCSGESSPPAQTTQVESEAPEPEAPEPEAPESEVSPEPTFEQRVEDKARHEREAFAQQMQRQREEMQARAQEDATVVGRARGLARRNRFAEAYEVMLPLLERSPNGARVHCEAGYYAHRADNYRAGSLLSRGLDLHGPPEEVSDSMRIPLAMCLFNRGRVYADRDQRDRAAAVYRASLTLRPNATVERALRDLGQISVVELEITARRPRAPLRQSGPDLTAVLESMAPTVCAAAAWRFERGDEIECQIDRRLLNADGEGPRLDFVVFRPADRGGVPSMHGTYDDLGYIALHPHDGADAFVFGPVSSPSVESHDPRAELPRLVSWIDLDGDGAAELLAEVHESTATSEDGCSDSDYHRTLSVVRHSEEGWQERIVTVGRERSEMCYVPAIDEEGEGEIERDEEVSGLPHATLDVSAAGLRFHQDDVERRFTLAELFERCDTGCSLDTAAGISE